MSKKGKIEYMDTINPNKILTRVMLKGKTVTHLDKRKEKERKKCREKVGV